MRNFISGLFSVLKGFLFLYLMVLSWCIVVFGALGYSLFGGLFETCKNVWSPYAWMRMLVGFPIFWFLGCFFAFIAAHLHREIEEFYNSEEVSQ